jgi:hypothetical protein
VALISMKVCFGGVGGELTNECVSLFVLDEVESGRWMGGLYRRAAQWR